MRETGPNLFAFAASQPAQPHSPTSQAAAAAIESVATSMRRAVLEYLRYQGERGATDDEMQSVLDLPGNTQRPRRRELQQAGLIRDSGRHRQTASGRLAVVWEAVS